MSSPHLQKIAEMNNRIAALLESARRSLSGESLFGVSEIHEISSAIAEMGPILANKSTQLAQYPEIAAPVALYKSQLIDLQNVLNQLTVMLTGQRDAMLSGSSHITSVSRWANRLEQTR